MSAVLLDEVLAVLKEASVDDAEHDARAIVSAATAPGTDAPERALAMARARAAGKPLGHLLGRVQFLGIELEAGPDALAPRAETELLGRTALAELGTSGESALRVIDMCCGAGNLACAIATQNARTRVWASDLTDGCVRLARQNVQRLGLAERVTVVQGDLFAPLAGLGLDGQVDLVVCNPPYISSARLARESARLLEHEPREAFDGGPYGLSIHQRVLRDAPAFLRQGGGLAFEFGVGQERQLELLFERTRQYEGLRLEKDALGRPRVAVAFLKRGSRTP